MRAAELGYEALALTDHDGVYGSLEFAYAAKALGLRSITGAEVTLADGSHVTLLVETPARLRQPLPPPHRRARPRAAEPAARARPPRRAEARASSASPAARGTGSPCATRTPPPASPARSAATASSSSSSARTSAATRAGTPPSATSRRPRRPHGRHRRRPRPPPAPRAPPGRPRRRQEPDVARGLRGRAARERRERSSSRRPARSPRASRTTATRSRDRRARRAARVRPHARARLPLPGLLRRRRRRPTSSSRRSAAARSRSATATRRSDLRARADARLREELALIAELGLSGFFLLHWEVLELAREVALEVRGPGSPRHLLPPGRGRGSSVGSIVCYLTGLSHVDPVAAGLALGRFLNRELVSVPDIDLDFPRDIREKLIVAVTERYGREHSALVASFATYRVARRDPRRRQGARAARRPSSSASPASPTAGAPRTRGGGDGARCPAPRRSSPRRAGGPSGSSAARSPGFRATSPSTPAAWSSPRARSSSSSRSSPRRWKAARSASGTRTPAPTPASSRSTCSASGCSRPSRSASSRSSRLRGEPIDLSRIPLDDPAVYREIQDADTVGLFQIESRAQMQSLLRTRPENLDDLTSRSRSSAPGRSRARPSTRTSSGASACARTRPTCRRTTIRSLAELLAETLGAIIFQEQVLEVAMALAGFTRRRGRGAAPGDEPQAEPGRDRGLPRALRRRARARTASTAETAELVFEKLAGFASFGFPKSHAAAFALLAYQSAWLRHHYPAEFLCALLNAQPMGFYPPASLVRDAQRRGVEVLPPDVNRSAAKCRLERDAVRVGLGYVKGLGEEPAARSWRSGTSDGAFRSVSDLAQRAPLDRPGLEALVASAPATPSAGRGASSSGGSGSRRAPSRVGDRRGRAPARAPARARPRRSPSCPSRRSWERMLADYRLTSLSVGVHPLELLRPHLPAEVLSSADFEQLEHGAGWRSRASSSRASARRPRAASSSCCSRTSTAR